MRGRAWIGDNDGVQKGSTAPYENEGERVDGGVGRVKEKWGTTGARG